ncbi:phosphatidylglycerophosphatase A [Fibrobacter sp. UWB12]|uniref:phosphatidylglycerophosphatase A family protein n=1 Tax=Fibrobacter sp. UWB12 TaxID=1896203 RepID=UPI00091835D4|nr:phosphatidylglycerophosphatase A [Fibrobacter sp. UWB12]SHK58544.1 phosphatidylglycerophosphatase [Fibrobacter sp. UWB12]
MNKQELKEKYGKKRIPHEWRKTDWFTTLVVTFFGSGMSPKAPGTMGSLAAAIVAYPMAFFFQSHLGQDEVLYIGGDNFGIFISLTFLAAALFVFFAAIPFVKKAMKDTGTEDPGWIVIDEVCGIFMALAFVPCDVIIHSPWILALAFVLFRFFDILKPLGIHKMEKLPGAWGVMADDLLGGIYAGILLSLTLTLIVLFS